MERPIFSLLLTTYHGVFDSYLVFPWRPIMFINYDQWSRLLGRSDFFCLFHTFIVDKNDEVKTTHFHQQKLRKYNQQGYKIPPAWQKLEMKKLLYWYFLIIKDSFKWYVMSSLQLCCVHITIWIKLWWNGAIS